MKKIILALLVAVFMFAGSAVAEAYKVVGTKQRVDLVSAYIQSVGHETTLFYTETETMGELKGKPWTGVQVVRSGAPDNEGIWVPVSDKAVATGNLCDDQKSQLRKLDIIIEPLASNEATPLCGDKCYGKVLTGSYQTLEPYGDIRLVLNADNLKYPQNAVTFKVEYHEASHIGWPYGTGWGPTIVLRNVTVEDPIALVQAHEGRIISYLDEVTTLKQGSPGKDGDSCYEVVLLRNGTILKNESPSSNRFQ